VVNFITTACELHSDKEATWRHEFAQWCSAFYAFKREYNHWLCLKVSNHQWLAWSSSASDLIWTIC